MTNEEAIGYLNTLYMALAVFPNQQISLGNIDKMKESVDMEIKVLEQQPCEDAVSRKDVHDMLENLPITVENHWFNWLQKACIRLADLPSVTPTRPTGRWILLDECSNSGYYCSECHKKVIKEGWSNTVKKVKYCPNCGARMAESEGKE